MFWWTKTEVKAAETKEKTEICRASFKHLTRNVTAKYVFLQNDKTWFKDRKQTSLLFEGVGSCRCRCFLHYLCSIAYNSNICFHLLRIFSWTYTERWNSSCQRFSFWCCEGSNLPNRNVHTQVSTWREECFNGISQSLFKKVQLEFPNSGKTRAWLYISKWLPQQFRCS